MVIQGLIDSEIMQLIPYNFANQCLMIYLIILAAHKPKIFQAKAIVIKSRPRRICQTQKRNIPNILPRTELKENLMNLL